ncbi:MAG: hypothetical protein IJN11_09275 [Oscillospiraceae bacterium]|nr:hypothetical protein [Oscillospiraceae bacterium]
MEKMILALHRGYFKAKMKMMNLAQEEDGMETLETVILIAVAVLVAGVIVTFLVGGNGEDGFVQELFNNIKEKINDTFGF